jgi:aminoglycoside phosphotransferase (APT) family kinase protein
MPNDSGLLRPYLWHSDLHDENIFVDPDDPTEVTAIIDWQSIEIAPLFAQVGKPPFIALKSPQATGLERPQLPSDFESLSKNERHRAQDPWLKQSLVVLYNTLAN